MAEDQAQQTEGLTQPAEPVKTEAQQSYEEARHAEHIELVGEENADREKAKQESAVSGAVLTEDQQKTLDEQGDEKATSTSITGSVATPASSSGVADNTSSVDQSNKVDELFSRSTVQSGGPASSSEGSPS